MAFNINFGQIVPPENVDVVMAAPKGPGHLVRRTYEQGSGRFLLCLPCIKTPLVRLAILRWPTPKASAATRAGVLETTFREETEDGSIRRAGRAVRWPERTD